MSTVKKKVRILDWFTPIQKKAKTQDGCFSTPQPLTDPLPEDTETRTRNDKTNDTEKEKDFNVSAIPHDPGLRINILDYNPNDQDVVRSEYMERGPCRPLSHNFPQTKFGVKSRRFNPRWFNKYDWLEYSIDKDAAFCLVCYLFKNKDDHVEDAFVKNGFKGWNRPIECFIGVVHVKGTIANKAIKLADHSLKSPSAYYIHCFAHQLQLTLVAVSKKSLDCGWLFETLTNLLNVVGVSCKRNEMLKEAQAQNVTQAFDDDEYASGKGKNQELGLGRPGDTRWGSHYKLINNVISLYSIIVDVLEKIGDVSSNPDDQLKAETVSYALESFDFVFLAHLMKRLFGVANDLNYALQKKDQDIVEAMSLVELTKERLQIIRNDGWEDHLKLTISFCEKNGIEVPKMEDVYVPRGRKKRRQQQVTNLHHFRVEVFCTIIDLQLQELNNRFNEVNSKLLICMGSLSPLNCFSSFNSKQLITLAEFYPNEFPRHELSRLSDQLDNYIHDMRKDERFIPLKDVGELSLKLVELKKHTTYDLVYLLIKLVLILPVATASVERTFSAMTYVKNKLRNSIGDQFLNDCLVTYIEKDVFFEVSDDTIMNRFQRMRRRRGKLY
ncbi:zinc finger MYM-type protein 1-like protein [Tanacetum coccineum]